MLFCFFPILQCVFCTTVLLFTLYSKLFFLCSTSSAKPKAAAAYIFYIYIYILLKHIFTLLFTTEGLECYHSPASFLPFKLLNMYSTVWPHPILVNSPKFISKTYLYIYIGKYTCYIFYRFCYIPVPMTCEY